MADSVELMAFARPTVSNKMRIQSIKSRRFQMNRYETVEILNSNVPYSPAASNEEKGWREETT
jgi:hypothetical protein